jgi:hypothetical protein
MKSEEIKKNLSNLTRQQPKLTTLNVGMRRNCKNSKNACENGFDHFYKKYNKKMNTTVYFIGKIIVPIIIIALWFAICPAITAYRALPVPARR